MCRIHFDCRRWTGGTNSSTNLSNSLWLQTMTRRYQLFHKFVEFTLIADYDQEVPTLPQFCRIHFDCRRWPGGTNSSTNLSNSLWLPTMTRRYQLFHKFVEFTLIADDGQEVPTLPQICRIHFDCRRWPGGTNSSTRIHFDCRRWPGGTNSSTNFPNSDFQCRILGFSINNAFKIVTWRKLSTGLVIPEIASRY